MLNRRTMLLTVAAMIAFAANSLLARIALRDTAIDAATFTTIRLASGAWALALLLCARRDRGRQDGDWLSALALFAYAAAFSFAYRSVPAGTGALLLFGAVQATMLLAGLMRGETLSLLQSIGSLLAILGLVGLVSPGFTAPPLEASSLMIVSGVAWGIYSLRGRSIRDPRRATAGNFLRATYLALAMSAVLLPVGNFDAAGAALAVASGALASGMGYVIWYAALPGLPAAHAAVAQLSVPILAACAGAIFLGEVLSLRLLVASIATLGGIALVMVDRSRVPQRSASLGLSD
jgi:drug/metabolite transporter (DMT)-like permease